MWGYEKVVVRTGAGIEGAARFVELGTNGNKCRLLRGKARLFFVTSLLLSSLELSDTKVYEP